MASSFRHAQHLLDARKPEELVNLQLELMVPLSEKTIAYGQHVLALATDIGSELGKAVDTKMFDLQKNMSTSMAGWTPAVSAGPNGQLLAIK
jgi:phasin family protein